MASHKITTRKLPSTALSLIREYSKPVTRPDWRTKHSMTIFSIYTDLRKKKLWGQKNFWRQIYPMILYKIEKTDWFDKYMYVLKLGADTYINNHKLSSFEILQVEKLDKDIIQYKMEVIGDKLTNTVFFKWKNK
jgi:hypothetical protein